MRFDGLRGGIGPKPTIATKNFLPPQRTISHYFYFGSFSTSGSTSSPLATYRFLAPARSILGGTTELLGGMRRTYELARSRLNRAADIPGHNNSRAYRAGLFLRSYSGEFIRKFPRGRASGEAARENLNSTFKTGISYKTPALRARIYMRCRRNG